MGQKPTLTFSHGVYEKTISQTTIEEVIDNIADYILDWYSDLKKAPILLGVLNGVVYFLVDLHRALQRKHFTAHIDTIAASSYTEPGKQGKVKITKLPKLDLNGRRVIIVEDIIDSGNTAKAIIDFIVKNYKTESLEIIALVLRLTNDATLSQERNGLQINYAGICCSGDEWLIGYGFDDNEGGRALPDIYKRIIIF
ncbi:MAG: phosphoribosyltransferase family protein [Candidatus Komeilibacteria bacterium]